MPKNTNGKPPRVISLPAHFDMAKFKANVAADDAQRQPSQEELAALYATDADIRDTYNAFEHSLESIVTRIAEQDPRMVDLGRKLLKQFLRDGAGRRTRRGRAPSPRPKSDAAAVNAAPAATASLSTAPLPMPEFDNMSGAEMYGG